MKTVIRNSYTPELGDYCNKIVVDKETNTIYFFDTDGVFTEVDNTRVDVDAIIAEAVAEAGAYTDEVADTKVDKEEGKGLSSNDFTDAEKEKLESVEEGAQENVIEIIKRNGSALTVTDKTVDISVPTKTSDLTNDSGFVINTVDDLVNYYTKTQTDSAIATETTAREGADQNLQEQIDAIAAGSDVVDIVGTYAELQAYDTSKLHNNDIIKVLSDETRSGATTYYRWSTTAEDFSYIGSQGPFYTKSESDSTFVPQTRTVNGKALSSDITLDATDVGALPNSTVIPTVNDATLTIQKNGTTVTTFTANSATNTTANITVPTKTSDLTNDGADGTDTYVEAGDLAAVATSGAYADLTGKPSIPTKTSDLTNDSDFVSDANYVHTDNNFTTTLKNKLNGIAAGAEVNVQSDWAQTDNTADDYIKNKPSIPTKTSDLTNDSGFITSAALPTKLSDLTNDTGFITKSVSDLTNYYDQTTINNMFNALSVPTKTSDLVNDSGFVTDTDYASASTGGVVKVGSGLSIDANGVLSSDGLTSVDWTDVTNKPTNVSYWTNDAGYITSAALPTKTSDLTNDSGFITSASLPTKTSDLTNDSGYITSSVNNLANYYTKADTYTQNEVNALFSALTIPTKTSDLTNDGSDGTSTYVEASDLATVATSGSYNDLTDKPAAFELVEMSYGESNAWAKFIDAYQGHKIVYCRASSNSNPATGTQGRKAFMAYVNNAENPTEVEFQYVRSVSSKTASQPVDQVFVYKLTNASGGTWTVQTRNMAPKLADGANTTVNYSNGTYTIDAAQPTVPTKTSDLTNDSGFLTSTDYATASTGGVIKVGGGLEITNGVLSATGGGTADAVEWANVLNKPTDVSYWTNDAGYITSAAIPSNVSAFSNDAGYLTSIPTASASTLGGVKVGSNLSIDANGVLSATQPTVGNATLTIQKNGTSAGTFTANATSNKTINITVPTTAADVSALPASTKYGASIAVSINTTDYKVTTTLKDQDGNTLGTAQVIDLPLESVVVNGSYDSTNKKIVLTLQSGSTIDIPVADLVAGLQSEITSTNKLASDLVDDTNQTHKFMTSAEKTKLSGIATGAEVNVQSDWDQTTTTADDYIKNKPTLATVATSGSYNDLSNKPTIPTVNNATLTIQKNGTTVKTFTANASTNVTANITVPTKTSDITNDSNFVASGDLATVATSGSYNDLSNKPTIPAAQVQSDWTQTTTTAVDYIKNKPTLATVATSGSYNDLSNKPTIPTVNNATLTIQKNGSNVSTFTANAASNVTANIVTDELQRKSDTRASMKPSDANYPAKATLHFSTVGAFDSQTQSGGYVDALLLNSWNNDSGGRVNALAATKQNDQKLYHYTGTFNGESWSGKKEIAYVDAIPTKTSDLTNDSGFALDSDVVHKTGAETITGEKTFSATKVKVLNGETVFNYSAERRWGALSAGTGYADWDEAKKDGTWHRIWRISFPANTNFWGRLTIGLTASYASFNASGYLEKQIAIAFNGANLYNNVGHYSALSINTEKDFRISECIWNADTSQWQIIIYSQQPQGNNAPRSVILKCETYTDAILTAFDGITIGTAPEISQIASYTNAKATPSGGTKTFYFADLPVYQDPYGREILNTDSVASATTLGGIKVGSGLSISNGVLSTQSTAPDWSDITNKPTFATVATSGSYNDLSNKPTIPAAQVQSDWTQTTTTAVDYIKNKPTLATVATSGSYNDLSNKPTIPTVNNATLTIQKNGTTVKTFTANASSNVTANITVPTAVSELSNDSGYQTAAQVQTAVEAKQDELTAGDHIDITNDVISATDYVHSDNPVSTTAVTPVVTGSMISNGTITADKLATGVALQLTLSTTDIGEGAALAANTLYGVYQ